MPPGNIPKSKRRRYVRYAIELEAALIVDKSVSVRCTILDFCSGGFFLGFSSSTGTVALPQNKTIQIEFSLGSEQSREDFRLNAEIMHASSNGWGVAVRNMPAATLEALKQEANAGAVVGSFGQRDPASTQSSRDTLKKEIKKMLDKELPILLDKFFDCFGDDLIKAYEQSPDFTDRSAVEDAVTLVKLGRESIISEYCSAFFFEIDHIADSARNQSVDTASLDGKSLALIEKEDFEDWLNLSSCIRRLTNHYKNPLTQIEAKLNYVFGSPAQAINNPLSPVLLCDNFREIFLQFNFNISTYQKLYTIFEKVLINQLSHLYDQFGKVLLNSGAPDRIVPQVIKQYDKVPPASKYREHYQPDNSQYIQSRPMAAPLVSNEDLQGLMQIVEHKNRPPLAQVARKMLDIINEAGPHPKTEDHAGKVENYQRLVPDQAVFSADEVISAISKLQKSVIQPVAYEPDGLALQKRLFDTLGHAGAGRKSFAANDLQQFDVYGKLFESLFNDIKVSSEIKSYMEKIHLALLSLSMKGGDFLDSDTHPAKNVLNQLATLESAVKSNRVFKKTNIKNILDKLVSRITQEAGTNPNIFAEVEQELTEVTEQVTKSVELNVHRMVEAYEGQQKLEIARRTVQRKIDKRIAGKSVPKIVIKLLELGWQHLLVITELNQELSKEQKLNYYAVIYALLTWLPDPDLSLTVAERKIIKTLNFIKKELSSVCTNAFVYDRFIEELSELLIGVGTPPLRKVVELVAVQPAKDQEAEPESYDKWMLQVRELKIGEWLTILREPEGYEPMKLIWIGQLPEILVFANRDGVHKLEYTRAELAELMRSGAANRIESLDTPVMDRATNAMLQKMHEKLIYNATHDPVTDLLIKDEFVKQLKQELAKPGDAKHMLFHVEVQDFRMITNSCGTEGGNQLLKKLTQLLTGQFNRDELLARLGDKAFGILCKDCTADKGFEIAEKLADLIGAAHFEWQDKSYPVTVSMGLVRFTESGYDVHQLLQQADSASVAAIDAGTSRIKLYSESDESVTRQIKLQEWAGQIDKILSENRLFIRCQKIAPVDSVKHAYSHYEILLGVRNSDGSIVSPDNFIPAVERCKRMPEIDQWIIRHVFAWIGQNRTFFDRMDGFSINLSGQSINTEKFLVFLKELLASSKVPAHKLIFEITESVAADSLVYVQKFIKEIKKFGCKFSLDDFGSGYSSYAYLKSLNADYLKIDGAFIRDIANNQADVAIVKSMNEIAHSLGMETVAEYVENDDILAILTGIGVDFVQGYGIEKPLLLTDLIGAAGPAEIAGLVEESITTEEKTAATERVAAEEAAVPAPQQEGGDDHGVTETPGLADGMAAPDSGGTFEDSDYWGF